MKPRVRAAALALLLAACAVAPSAAQRSRAPAEDREFGPIVRAYLGYLRNQQEVVDDRISRREVDRAYYVRNSNRIRALRQMAIRIARETENDFLPELEAVTRDEFTLLFDEPPRADSLSVGETLLYQFRFLGAVVSGRDRFYVFARLDPFEQAELKKKAETERREAQQQSTTAPPATNTTTTPPRSGGDEEPAAVRPRRASP
ncbi:MAG TPA: hypothetical protein VFX96_01015, partial [Pyrinomonadaceae bacterium]|nr:hypothetical protein [Pyrinomonadaceae bacterium]